MNNFENSNFTGSKKIYKGKVGILEDGRTINVREVSTDGRPTLEIYDPQTNHSIKIRYGTKESKL